MMEGWTRARYAKIAKIKQYHGTREAAGERRRASERASDRAAAGDRQRRPNDTRATVAARGRRRDRPGERTAAGESNSRTGQQQYSCTAISSTTHQQPPHLPCVYNCTAVHSTVVPQKQKAETRVRTHNTSTAVQ